MIEVSTPIPAGGVFVDLSGAWQTWKQILS